VKRSRQQMQFPLKQAGVAGVQLYKSTQMSHAVYVDKITGQTNLVVTGIGNMPGHTNLNIPAKMNADISRLTGIQSLAWQHVHQNAAQRNIQ